MTAQSDLVGRFPRAAASLRRAQCRPEIELVEISAPTPRASDSVAFSATVLEPVTQHSGLVRLEGDVWTARSSAGAALPEGREVFVHRIDGATAVVSDVAPAHAPGADGEHGTYR